VEYAFKEVVSGENDTSDRIWDVGVEEENCGKIYLF
jgi:hypothetical protein